MSNPWRFFITIELLLLLLAMWQFISNPSLLIGVIIGAVLIITCLRKKERSRFQNFLLIVGLIFFLVSVMNSPAIWIMLVFAVVFIGLKGVEITGIEFGKNALWRQKQIKMVETEEPREHGGQRKRHAWFGNERLGSEIYEWDDINLDILVGDTIIDLGNTLLPKEDSIVIVRKGIGKTRILVPVGVGISLDHSTLLGHVIFEEEKQQLKNEQVKFYSADYDSSTRRLKLITNTLVGDLEVIRV